MTRTIIRAGALIELGAALKSATRARRALLVTDENVNAVCGDRALDSLKSAGFTADRLVLPPGEMHKSVESALKIIDAMIALGMERSDALVALGGGVVTDTGGFAAATYLRGIDCALCPTTLLCAVDACEGGKTAVDLPQGKNLMGAFHQPALILCDTDVLRALPDAIFRQGIAEALKHGLLGDEGLLTLLESGDPRADINALVENNLRVKRAFVSGDERDAGKRRLLNLGHTYAHALEAQSGYAVSHGEAVGLGLVWESALSASLLLCDGALTQRIRRILIRNGLPCEPVSEGSLLDHMARDKKNEAGDIGFCLPLTGGGARFVALPQERVLHMLQQNK